MTRVEPAGASAVALLSELHGRCFAEAWEAPAIASLLAMSGAFGLLAVDGDAPVGFVIAGQAVDEMEIVSIGVLPDARRAGVAQALITAAHARGAAAGAVACFLEVAERNVAARALYLGLGYVQVGRRPHYYGEEDALLLRRDLVSA